MKIGKKQKWILVISGISLALILGYIMGSNEKAFVPDDMAGRWAADSSKYEGCYLELSPVSVLFGTTKDTVKVNFVQSIEKRGEEDEALYTIHYKNRQGEKGDISLLWDPSKKEIRLKNQKEITWNKVSPLLY